MANELFQLKEVLLIDHLWEVTTKKRINNRKLKVKTSNRILSVKFFGEEFKVWKHKLEMAIE